jgi:hypothetical protein
MHGDMYIFFLVIYIYCFMSRSSVVMSPQPVKGCKIYAYAQRSGPLNKEGSLTCHTCCDTGP